MRQCALSPPELIALRGMRQVRFDNSEVRAAHAIQHSEMNDPKEKEIKREKRCSRGHRWRLLRERGGAPRNAATVRDLGATISTRPEMSVNLIRP